MLDGIKECNYNTGAYLSNYISFCNDRNVICLNGKAYGVLDNNVANLSNGDASTGPYYVRSASANMPDGYLKLDSSAQIPRSYVIVDVQNENANIIPNTNPIKIAQINDKDITVNFPFKWKSTNENPVKATGSGDTIKYDLFEMGGVTYSIYFKASLFSSGNSSATGGTGSV